jgi:hypothetical protein
VWFVARRSIQLSYGRISLEQILPWRFSPQLLTPNLLVSAAGGLYPAELRAQYDRHCVTSAYSRFRSLFNREFRPSEKQLNGDFLLLSPSTKHGGEFAEEIS